VKTNSTMRPPYFISIIFAVSVVLPLSGCAQGIPMVDQEEIRFDIEYLASDSLEGRETGTKGEQLAAHYIASRMDEIGLLPSGDDESYFQTFSLMLPVNPHDLNGEKEELKGTNVVGLIDNKADHTVVIGAHYDHLGYGGRGSLHAGSQAIHNGADDNASGVAAMLQLAEILSDRNEKSNYLFIAFSGEEKGLLGSNYYTKNATVDLSTINYMFNMDMVGRLNKDKVLSINGVGTSPVWSTTLDKIQVDGLQFVTTESGFGPSDHTSFYKEDIPVLHFFTGQHEDYHKPTDDPEKINYEGVVSVVEVLHQIIETLNDQGKISFTKSDDSNTDIQRSFKVTLGVIPDYLFDGEGMRIDGVRDGRPAAVAGLDKGDVVVKMGEYEVTGMNAYMDCLERFSPGDQIIVVVLRDGARLEKEVIFD